ncbi:hypothetical protein BIW11_08741 [Tropilaelaps mercedesae]|uniref:Uncharacterized protein n=1 Tax=Tropilaelaps mercedesae TaxID=418985 RepID=A0A1V9XNE8_9ACAR|nr:hypothetical protein BIW11_08741 [Tropilaelaps mercedesae]
MSNRRMAFFTASHSPVDYAEHASDYYGNDENQELWGDIRKIPQVATYESSVYLALVLTAALCLLTLVLLCVVLRMG